jgi:hypothetical protein
MIERIAYQDLIYGLPSQFSDVIASSTLRLFSTSALTAKVEGEIAFRNGVLLRVSEVIDFDTGTIEDYSYTAYRDSEKIRWYDPQPHPEVLELAATFPHHYHAPPNIKHNRQPAPGISFDSPNLARLVEDCGGLG